MPSLNYIPRFVCTHTFFFVRVSREFHIVSTVYSLKGNKATAGFCGFKVVPCTFLLKKEKIKGGPATPVDEFEMLCYDKAEPASALGDEFC